MKKVILWISTVSAALLTIIAIIYFPYLKRIVTRENVVSAQVPSNQAIREYNASELSKYNGTDPNLPIYIAYEGKVYDVTEGRRYYQEGGVYHLIAGKDSTEQLNIAGGEIIKRKYPVVGIYSPSK